MVTKEIKSIEDFMSHLFTLDETDYFRGHSSIDYKLIPSIGRLYPKRTDIIPQVEKEIFEEFKRKYSLYTDTKPANDFEFLILAQHYGLPTRLLDWTYNPLVALYFATCSDFEKKGCIFQSFPNRLINIQNPVWQPFSVDQNYTIIPNLTNVRYKNQNGLFVIYSTPWEEDISLISCQYIIPAECKETIQWKLRKIGISRSFIFPSLDNLCADIMAKYRERYKPYE